LFEAKDILQAVFETWLDQIRRDNKAPPADLWRQAISCGHLGVMLRSLH